MIKSNFTEASALSEYEYYFPGEFSGEMQNKKIELQQKISEMKERYKIAKKASVGTVVECPTCKKRFLKKYYQQAFHRHSGHRNCKDLYWNLTDTNRRERAYLQQR